MNHILVTCRQKGKQQKHTKCLTIDDKSSSIGGGGGGSGGGGSDGKKEL